MGDLYMYTCGLGQWRPTFLQRFANSRSFIVVFGLLGTIQAMAFIYFVATITTLEKRFHLPSETMGILMSGNEISQILLVLLLSYLGGHGNRPLWMAWGVAISALSCYILASPHFIFGAGQTALSLTQEFLNTDIVNKTINSHDKFICSEDRLPQDFHVKNDSQSWAPMIILFVSQFVLGIGTSLYYSLGHTYMDDNTKKTTTPLLLGITLALRTLGPAMGFVLGYFCLNLYVDPRLTPVIDRRDPRWIGAWWLGWIVLGGTMLLLAFLLSVFPKHLPKLKVAAEEKLLTIPSIDKTINGEPIPSNKSNLIDNQPENSKSINQFFKSLYRIIKNPLLMVNNFVAISYILGASGYMNFYTKYTETQYSTSAAQSNVVAALSTLFSLVIGFLGSGALISRFKPRTSILLLWNIFIGCIYFSGELVIMHLKCDDDNLQTPSFTTNLECNWNCHCESIRYSPVCNTATNQTFFSACHAGCTTKLPSNAIPTFTNCSCVDSFDILTQGPCPTKCTSNFYLFIGVVCFMQMMGSMGRITNILINYRCVKVKDKAMAQGLSLFLVSLFAFIPGPIVFGKIIDNACLIWDNSGGTKGNCWFYDKDKFRVYLNATAASFTCFAIILDIALFFLGRNINLYEDNKPNKKK